MKTTSATTTKPIVNGDLSRARRKQAAIRKLIRQTGKNGRNIVSTMEDTPEAREAWALGEAWRKAQTDP